MANRIQVIHNHTYIYINTNSYQNIKNKNILQHIRNIFYSPSHKFENQEEYPGRNSTLIITSNRVSSSNLFDHYFNYDNGRCNEENRRLEFINKLLM